MAVDVRRIPTEFTLGKKKFAVVIEIVNRHLESVVHQSLPELSRGGIFALRYEVEGGTKPEPFFQIHQLAAFLKASPALDIMGQHQGKLLASRPAGPVLGRRLGTSHDGPDVPHR